jgi:hypothetical protein
MPSRDHDALRIGNGEYVRAGLKHEFPAQVGKFGRVISGFQQVNYYVIYSHVPGRGDEIRFNTMVILFHNVLLTLHHSAELDLGRLAHQKRCHAHNGERSSDNPDNSNQNDFGSDGKTHRSSLVSIVFTSATSLTE